MRRKLPSKARSVITGAGSGFGRAVALELASRGARVLASDIDLESAEATVELCRAKGATAFAMKADVRDPLQVEALSKKAKELWGGTDVLVNNAGMAVVGEIGSIPVDDWKLQVEINLYGPIWGCHYFVPEMKERGNGFILNVASSAGIVAAPLMGPYNVTKAGVIALSETLFTELAKDNVQVTALCPTFFRTNIHASTRSHGAMNGVERTKKLVTQAKWSAEQIATIAIDGMLAGKLYVLPQNDAKATWRAKRLLGQTFYDLFGMATRRGALDRAVGKKPA
jgi:NAD(P)-dependent dehydrogenase (short-subunit alcohol dehydrogenase family)